MAATSLSFRLSNNNGAADLRNLRARAERQLDMPQGLQGPQDKKLQLRDIIEMFEKMMKDQGPMVSPPTNPVGPSAVPFKPPDLCPPYEL